MKHIVGTGTDIASILIFDPLALPSDYDERPKAQWEIIRRLHQEQRVFHVQTGADGAYLVHAFVDEPMPDYLGPFVHEPYVHEHFDAPSGQVYCAGLEYAFRSNNARLKKHPRLGGSFSLAPGRYRLTMHRTEYPDEMMEEELRQKVTPNAFRLHQSMGYFVTLAVLSMVGCSIAFFKLPTAIWTAYVLPLAIVLVAPPFIVSRLPSYRNTDKIWKDLQLNYPSLVAEFQRATKN